MKEKLSAICILISMILGKFTLLGFSSYAMAQTLDHTDNIIELGSTIKGSQEQPEVVYIVPWQDVRFSRPDDIPYRVELEEKLKLLDRDQLKRSINLHEILRK